MVKPEVKFLSHEIASMSHLMCFDAFKGLLSAQKRQKSPVCASKTKM